MTLLSPLEVAGNVINYLGDDVRKDVGIINIGNTIWMFTQ